MRLHCLQHVPFEVPGAIEEWARRRGFELTTTRLFDGEFLPDVDAVDWLVVMGGPMNVYEHETYPWLDAEKDFIEAVIDADKVVLGVCLGAQLVADVLGGDVTRNPEPEIGWFPVTLSAAALESEAFGRLPATFTALHWHGDTFAIPPGAEWMASSEACENQAFQWGERVFGLQFHLEVTPEEVAELTCACAEELTGGTWIASAEELTGHPDLIETSHRLLSDLLDGIAASANCAF
jgi:GMP synthase-like glutamine amidotransferase